MDQEYPKIDTLFDRDETTFKVVLGKFRRPEFETVSRWLITEKIDGTNIRVRILPPPAAGAHPVIMFGGKTDNAQIPAFLLAHLQQVFAPDRCQAVWDDQIPYGVVLYGEGYGERIQKGGGNYREGVSFRLFDVWVPSSDPQAKLGGWWLEWPNVEDVARKLGVKTVPVLFDYHRNRDSNILIELVRDGIPSLVAGEEKSGVHIAEGVVARSVPALFNRKGERVMWKLKSKDFPQQSELIS